jgi:peptide/nickel transport system substrate-binding protein
MQFSTGFDNPISLLANHCSQIKHLILQKERSSASYGRASDYRTSTTAAATGLSGACLSGAFSLDAGNGLKYKGTFPSKEDAKNIQKRRHTINGFRLFRKVASASALLICFSFCFTPPEVGAQIPELTIAIGFDTDTFNPQEQTTSLFINLCELIYDSLLFENAEGKLEPRLATKVDVSNDGFVYTLHLRKGVKFSDGTPFDAQAMKLTIDRALDPKMRVPQRYLINMIRELKVVDDYTLVINLSYPFAPFMQTLSTFVLLPISPAAIEEHGEEVRQKPVGAGPYVLKEWVKGDRIVLVRNESYYGQKATVEKLTFKIVPESAAREAMLRAGEIDICYSPSPANVAALKSDPNITVDMPLDTRTISIGLNCQKGATKSKLVRQAFNYAVDKKAIVSKVLFDTAVSMDGPCSPTLFGYHKMANQYDYSPEKAKELLKKAGFDFSQTIHLRAPQGRYLFEKQISETVQVYLRAIGVQVELKTYEWPNYVARLLKPLDETKLELFLLGWGPMIRDADAALYGQFHSSMNPPKGLAPAFYSAPAFDETIEAARMEQDPQKRLALFKKASEIVWDDCPWIWLYVKRFVLAYRSHLKGLVVTGTEKFFPTYVTKK